MNTFALAPLILLLPVVGVLFNGLLGRRFVESNQKNGERWTGWFASLMTLGAFAVSVTLLLSLVAHDFHAEIVPLFNWIDIPSAGFLVNWAMQVDTLSVTMMLVVTGVGSLIYLYGDRLHARRSALPALLRVPEPVHRLHADPGHRPQLPGPVRGMGGRRPVLLPADQLLVGPAG